MLRVFWMALLFFSMVGAGRSAEAEAAVEKTSLPEKKVSVIVIPVHDEIAEPVLYILRRGLKEKADVVVLDLKTPGGALNVTFDIMEALAKFPGKTIAYVDDEAMSAGAFISATTDEIWFAPKGVIGAAAPVNSSGQDIDKTMKEKVVSYLKARVRAISEGKGYRGRVISAMIDEDEELKIGDKVIKPKGGLLSLTAREASEKYGEPLQPLLAAGVARDIDDLLTQKYSKNGYTVRELQVTWSEELAQFLNALSPVLMGLGMLALFIEFKTPGFGVFGIAGIVLLGIVFLSHFVAGFSGHEPILLFGLGLILLILELIFFHTAALLGVVGVACMLGALVWSMTDLWPGQPVDFSGGVLLRPLADVGLGLLIAVVLAVALLRFMPRGWMWDRMVLQAAVVSSTQVAGATSGGASLASEWVGREAIAVTPLRPFGQIEIDGARFEAQVAVGSAERGARVRVVGRTDFGLAVEPIVS